MPGSKSLFGSLGLTMAALFCISWTPTGPGGDGIVAMAQAADTAKVSDYRTPRARPYRYRSYECYDVHIGKGRWERRCRPIHYGPPYWPYVYRPRDGWSRDWDDHDRWDDRRYDRRWKYDYRWRDNKHK